jgi:hypothetical protein
MPITIDEARIGSAGRQAWGWAMHYFFPLNDEYFQRGNRRSSSALDRLSKAQRRSRPSQLADVGAMGKNGLTKTEADDLLDWLEANGYQHYEVCSVNEDSFSVRWWN